MFSLLVVISSIAPVAAALAGGGLLLLTGWQGVFVVLCLLGLTLRDAPAWLFLLTLLPTVSSASMVVPGATAP